MDELIALALQYGFTAAAELDPARLEFLPEVRAMCAAGKCNMYGKSWACPPAVRSLEESAAEARKYKRGLVVQTTGKTEDSFDFESIEGITQKHKENFLRLTGEIRQRYPGCLPMNAGACCICEKCTYPDAPCRFPQRAIPSMEAYGLLVTKVCSDSGLPYYYGPDTMTFTSCYLID